MPKGSAGLFAFIAKFFVWFGRQKRKFTEIKQDGEKAKKSVYFGVKSVLYILFGLTVSLGIIYAGYSLIGSNIIAMIAGIVLIAAGCIAVLVLLPYSLTCAVLQLRMNRRAIGFLSLFLFLAVVAGAVVIFLYFANYIG